MILSLRFIFVIILMTWCQPASTLVLIAAGAAVAGIVSGTLSTAVNMGNVIAGSARYFGTQPDRENGRKYYMSAEQNAVIDQFIDLRRESRVNFEKIGGMLPAAIEAPYLVNLQKVLGDIFQKTNMIDSYYNDVISIAKEFIEYYSANRKNETMHLTYMSETVKLIREVRGILSDNLYENILELFVKDGQAFLHETGALQSPQQYLTQLLERYVLTEQKAFLTFSYCYYIQDSFGGGRDFSTPPIKIIKDQFARSLNRTVAKFQKYMLQHSSTISTEFYRSNPSEHTKDVTYTELERVFQKFATRQENLMSNSLFDKINPCHGKCEDHTKVTNVPCKTEECSHSTCNGTLYDCQYVIDTDAKICVATNDSIRKYDYILYGNGRLYGQREDGECPSEILVNADTNGLCNQCLCTCADKSTPSDRFICTEEQSTNIAANYVLTGVRLRKINHIIYLQIQEGILLPNSQIQENSTRWIPIESCLKDLIIELDWYKLRELDLGPVKLPKTNRILTGISFTKMSTPDFRRIAVQTTSMIFKIATGKLVPRTMRYSLPPWQDNYMEKLRMLVDRYKLNPKEMKRSPTGLLPSTEYNHAELRLNDRSLPTRFQSTYGFVKTDQVKFVKFQTSGMDDDVGQSTIPFLDIQEVAPYPPVPLSGIGVYHKAATPSDGGYVGLSVFTYDIANRLRPDLSSDFDSVHDAKIKKFASKYPAKKRINSQ